jgi:hypothetical protein
VLGLKSTLRLDLQLIGNMQFRHRRQGRVAYPEGPKRSVALTYFIPARLRMFRSWVGRQTIFPTCLGFLVGLFSSIKTMVALFVVGAGVIYLDKLPNGSLAAYGDGFSVLELCRKH